MAYTTAQAQQFYQSMTPEQRAAVDASGGPSVEWLTNAVLAGDPKAYAAVGGRPEGAIATADEGYGEGYYSPYQNAASSSEWMGKRKPTVQELRKWAKDTNQPEDYQRFSDAAVSGWIERNWDVAKGTFVNNYGDSVLKPDDRGPNTPEGYNGTGDAFGSGGGGGGGGGGYGGYSAASTGYGGETGTAGPLPQFNAPTFTPPTAAEAFNDPGYQFALQQGEQQLQQSAAAKGTLRTGGTLKDILDYGQQAATQQYGNVYNRAANTFGINYQGAKDEFAPQYGGWSTMYGGDLQKYLQAQNAALSQWSTRYGGDLSKYLQRENNIYGLINTPAPAPPSY